MSRVNLLNDVRQATADHKAAGDRLRAAVAAANTGQVPITSIADAAGVTRQTVYNWLDIDTFPTEPPVGTSIRMPNGRTFTRCDHHPDFHWKDGRGWYRWSEVQGRARRGGGEIEAAPGPRPQEGGAGSSGDRGCCDPGASGPTPGESVRVKQPRGL